MECMVKGIFSKTVEMYLRLVSRVLEEVTHCDYVDFSSTYKPRKSSDSKDPHKKPANEQTKVYGLNTTLQDLKTTPTPHIPRSRLLHAYCNVLHASCSSRFLLARQDGTTRGIPFLCYIRYLRTGIPIMHYALCTLPGPNNDTQHLSGSPHVLRPSPPHPNDALG